MAFLPVLGGGKTLFQCYCRGLDDGSPVTFSGDVVFSNKQTLFGLVVLSDSVGDAIAAQKELSSSYGSDPLTRDATHIVDSLDARRSAGSQGLKVVQIASALEFAASLLVEDDQPQTDMTTTFLERSTEASDTSWSERTGSSLQRAGTWESSQWL